MPAYTHYMEPSAANYSCRICWADQQALRARGAGEYEGTYGVYATGYDGPMETVTIRVEIPGFRILGGSVYSGGNRTELKARQFDVVLCNELDDRGEGWKPIRPYDIAWK